jgi:hypothetical protein
VQALEQSNVKREYLMRLKHAFDKADIRQPRSTVTFIEHAPRPTPEGPPSQGLRPTSESGDEASPSV